MHFKHPHILAVNYMATLTFRENKTAESFFQLNFNVYDVVQFYPWFKFYFLLFMGMVMYGDEFETKENKFKPRIKLNHNIYIDVMWLTEKDLQREIKNKGHQFC